MNRHTIVALSGVVVATATFAAAMAAAPAVSASPTAAPPNYTVVVANGGVTGVPLFISNATRSAITPASPPVGSAGVAITPDGKTAYILNGHEDLVPVALPSGVSGATIAISGAYLVRISPRGALAWTLTTHGIVPVNLASQSAGTAFVPSVNGSPLTFLEDVAFSPDGRFAYVTDLVAGVLVKLNVATHAVVGSVSLGTGRPDPSWVVLSTDGATAYVSKDLGISVVNVSTMTVTSTIADHGRLAVSSDGGTLWVLAGDTSIDSVDLTTNAVTQFMTLPSGLSGRSTPGFGLTPDGKTFYLSESPVNSGDNIVEVVDHDSKKIVGEIHNPGNGGSLAITPDQAPVAEVTVSTGCGGTLSSFDASRSHVRFGEIVKYEWNFGDGSAARLTSGPQTSHIYAHPGTYTATVTETDSAGTSTALVSDGQTVLLNGGPSARKVTSVRVGICSTPTPTGSGSPTPTPSHSPYTLTPSTTPTLGSSTPAPISSNPPPAQSAVPSIEVPAGSARTTRPSASTWEEGVLLVGGLVLLIGSLAIGTRRR